MFFKLYIIAFSLFLGMDMLWLGVVAKNYYRSQVGDLLKDPFSIAPALLFYAVYIFGLVLFVISPSIQKSSVLDALLYGAVFGFVCYATYDLTNLATVKNWPLQLVFVDILWGTVLSTFTSFVAYKIYFWIY